MAAARVEEGSDQVADHVVEKSVAADLVDEQVGFFCPCGREDGPDIVLASRRGGLACSEVGIGGGKGCKVVFANDERCSVLHLVYVERPVEGVDVAREPRRANLSAKDAVLIGFRADAVARVEVGRGVFSVVDSDGAGKCPVEGAEQVGRRDRRGEFDGGDLGAGVDAGIGAPASLRENGFSGDAFDGGRELALDSSVAGLDLPAVEIGSVIGEGELPVHAACSQELSADFEASIVRDNAIRNRIFS